MTQEEFEAWVLAQRWTFAKTMPTVPHEYVVKGKGHDPAEFVRAVEFVRANGYLHRWGSRVNAYVDTTTHFYWTMGAPIEETTILNRGKFEDYPNRVAANV